MRADRGRSWTASEDLDRYAAGLHQITLTLDEVEGTWGAQVSITGGAGDLIEATGLLATSARGALGSLRDWVGTSGALTEGELGAVRHLIAVAEGDLP